MSNPRKVTVRGRFVGGGLFALKEGKSKFSACITLEGPDDLQKMADAKEVALDEKFGNKIPKSLEDWTVRVGDDEEYATFDESFINPKSKKAVPVMKRVNGVNSSVTEEDEVVYPGCYVYASVEVYAYAGNPKEGIKPGVSTSLLGVCFWKDGERLGSSFSQSDFDAVESEFDEESFGSDESADATASAYL